MFSSSVSNQYVERSAYANVYEFNRENFSAAMLESLSDELQLTYLHTKIYNLYWHILLNNSSSEYRTSPKP